MSNFLKDAMSELEHVVWPTGAESKKYMIYTVGVIIIMAALLAVIGYALRGSLV
jgi:preprotein translocase SecE subunit